MKDGIIMEPMIEPVTKEELDEMISSFDLIAKISGFDTLESMDNFKIDASLGMIRFGGSFTNALGHALSHADIKNTVKILTTFKNECKEHATLYKKWLENRDKIEAEE